MEYRKLPRGDERFSVIGVGMATIEKNPPEEIEAILRLAMEHGVNYFDVCLANTRVFEPLGRAIRGRRDKVFLQMHFGATYDDKGEYAWSRDLDAIRRTFEWELKELGTDYTDMGYLHCTDTDEDFDKLVDNGVLDYLKELKRAGVVHHIGFSSHTPVLARRILATGLVDMFMFSINPAYDFAENQADLRLSQDRMAFYRECEQAGVGISVMKVFHAGKLLDAKTSPFGMALTRNQCIQYALDRPAVLTVLPGIGNRENMKQVLSYVNSTPEERDYSAIGGCTVKGLEGTCMYCNHCQPCPAGIDVGLVNKYYDLTLAGDERARSHYDKLSLKAGDCLQCGHCDGQCPFHVAQSRRMREIRAYFSA
ncbi:MAG: aldo/keto reductase [Clostridia bacterium]|nr:aldo/keto reductase [Clostridia bacterium]